MSLEVKYLPEDADLPEELFSRDRTFRRKVSNGKVSYFEETSGRWLDTPPEFFGFQPTGHEPHSLLIGDRPYKLHRERLYIPENARPEEMSVLYDYLATSGYEERFVDLDFNVQVYHQLFDLALSDTSSQATPVILDYGCGPGTGILAAKRYSRPLELAGVDVSAEMVKISREKGLPALTIDGYRDLPYSTGSFNAVVMAFVADFLPDVQPYRLIHRVLRNHGSLAFNLYRPSADFRERLLGLLTEAGYSSIEFSNRQVSSSTTSRNFWFVVAVKRE